MERDFIMQFFKFDHLPHDRQAVSRPFGELAEKLHAELPRNPERSTALRKLLEAKDAAVRASFAAALLLCLLPSLAFAADAAPSPAGPRVLELVLQYVVAPLLTVLGPLLVALAFKAVQLVSAKTSTSKVAAVAAPFAELAASVVADLDKTLRPQLQAALADGVLTAGEKQLLRDTALARLKERAPSGLLKAAQDVFGPMLDTWLSGLVERSVTERRAVEAQASAPVPPSA